MGVGGREGGLISPYCEQRSEQKTKTKNKAKRNWLISIIMHHTYYKSLSCQQSSNKRQKLNQNKIIKKKNLSNFLSFQNK